MIKAAMNRADITPPQGLELAGYPHYPRYNEGFHDPLYAACMYLNNGEQEIAMVTLDLLFFSKKHVTEVRRRVAEKTGIPGTTYGYGNTGIASLGADEDGIAYYYVSYDGYNEHGCNTTVRLCRADDEQWIAPVE